MRGIDGEPHPAALGIAPIGVAKAGRGTHDAVFEDAACAVGRLVQRIELGRREARCLFQHRTGELGRLAAEPGDGIEHEAHIGERGGVGHRRLSGDDAAA